MASTKEYLDFVMEQLSGICRTILDVIRTYGMNGNGDDRKIRTSQTMSFLSLN